MTTPSVSFEFFPPRNLDQSFKLWETARTLAPLGSDFVSVTYGAGGTTRQLTHEAVTALASTAVAYMSYELVEVPGARLVRQATAKQPATIRKVEEPA